MGRWRGLIAAVFTIMAVAVSALLLLAVMLQKAQEVAR